MEQRVTALYFSPTHGTRAYVRAVAAAIPGEHREVDLTRPEERRKEYHFTENDLVILGVPVYYGRVPEVEGLLDGLHGGNTPVILLAVYGNRLIDDALVELSDLCVARGFRTLAAGSFVAPHTFSAKVGKGRPSEADLAAAAELGRRAADKLSGAWEPPALPGNRPYRDFQRAPFYPEGDGSCTGCGACAAVCPNHVIEVVPEHKRKPVVLCQNKDKGAQTRKACTAGCIGCMKCAKACPREAITVENNVAYIDQEKCVGCQLCVKECPVGVIHVPAAM